MMLGGGGGGREAMARVVGREGKVKNEFIYKSKQCHFDVRCIKTISFIWGKLTDSNSSSIRPSIRPVQGWSNPWVVQMIEPNQNDDH